MVHKTPAVTNFESDSDSEDKSDSELDEKTHSNHLESLLDTEDRIQGIVHDYTHNLDGQLFRITATLNSLSSQMTLISEQIHIMNSQLAKLSRRVAYIELRCHIDPPKHTLDEDEDVLPRKKCRICKERPAVRKLCKDPRCRQAAKDEKTQKTSEKRRRANAT